MGCLRVNRLKEPCREVICVLTQLCSPERKTRAWPTLAPQRQQQLLVNRKSLALRALRTHILMMSIPSRFRLRKRLSSVAGNATTSSALYVTERQVTEME